VRSGRRLDRVHRLEERAGRGPNASAYASAKAASLHLARCLALEGAPHGIRVNTVNPDAVIRGSRIWDGDWRKERAGAHGIDPGSELEEHLPQPLDAQARRAARGRRRSGLLPRLRRLGQVDRQHRSM
jgi:NAD(P)-dependent dehydrogenase (short-subunit alcohol dehydrogenase family)